MAASSKAGSDGTDAQRRARTGPRQLPTLTRVLEELGRTFLSELAPVPDAHRRIGGVVVYDPLDEQAIPDGAFILGVGLTADPGLQSVIDDIGTQGAGALVLREPVTVDEGTADLARRHGVA